MNIRISRLRGPRDAHNGFKCYTSGTFRWKEYLARGQAFGLSRQENGDLQYVFFSGIAYNTTTEQGNGPEHHSSTSLVQRSFSLPQCWTITWDIRTQEGTVPVDPNAILSSHSNHRKWYHCHYSHSCREGNLQQTYFLADVLTEREKSEEKKRVSLNKDSSRRLPANEKLLCGISHNEDPFRFTLYFRQ